MLSTKPHQSLASHYAASVPEVPFELLEQSSPYQERITINGVQKRVHVVVKKSPFQIQVGFRLGVNPPLDFNNYTYDAVLLYDSHDSKPVDYVRDKPVDIRTQVSESGEELSVELKVKVLTSQHENSLFRIKIIVLDPNTGLPFHPYWYIVTAPVKVISKPELSKRKKTSATEPTTVRPTKRKANDLVAEAVARLAEQQRQQQEAIQRFMKLNTFSDVISSSPEQRKCAECPAAKCPECPAEENIESVFYDFFNIYLRLSPQDKAMKIRKVVRSSTTREREDIQDMLGTFAQEMANRLNSQTMMNLSMTNFRPNNGP
jgi:hypothetical protein